MSAPQAVFDLVDHFERDIDAFKSGKYNEAQLRFQFIDPLFKALGWDVYNQNRYAEAYKDVIHEDALRIGTGVKAPDYCFRIGGARKFFVEAKKPSVFIKEEMPPAYQLRRYAWTAKLPLSVLSDFEEFAIYDCRIKPKNTDRASTARIFYCTYRELPEKWDYIAGIFSRDAVLKGSFDKYAAENKAKRGTAEVDADFLEEIENWRKRLAENLALRNQKLSQRELNFAVQRIIDRIIFLRIAEDRGLETYSRLQALTSGPRIYPRLCQLFEAADARYNSGLFHFQKERHRHEAPDELTLGLDIDDKLLKEILKNLYYPDSPYAFSVLSADILGQVYEQFLGKIITLTAGHHARVDDKPEVKKAGGVYYTPTYVVDYIVRETVGKLLDGIAGANGSGTEALSAFPPHPDPLPMGPMGEGTAIAAPPQFTNPSRESSADPSPEGGGTIPPLPKGEGRGEGKGNLRIPNALHLAQSSPRAAIAALQRVSELRILDPACGSGSFLIGAYQFLLDWHLTFYTQNDPAKWAKEVTRAKRGGGVKLKTAKHPVLVQTKSGGWQLSIAERKRILLDNIYGVDIDGQAVEVTKLSLLLKVLEGDVSLAQLTFGLEDRVLPDLGDNIKCGNSLIGPDFYAQPNLPDLSEEERFRINVFDWRAEFAEVFKAGGFDAVIGNPPYVRIQGFPSEQIAYFCEHYSAATKNFDLYIPFLEKGHSLLSERGRLGMIVPNKFFKTDYGEGLRALLSRTRAVSRVVDFGANQVFAATTYTCLLFLSKARSEVVEVARSEASKTSMDSARFSSVPASSLTEGAWNFGDQMTTQIETKIARDSVRLLDLPATMSRGSSTGNDEVFVVSARDHGLEREAVKIPLFATDFGRYELTPSKEWRVIFPYVFRDAEASLISEEELEQMFPKTHRYLKTNRTTLERRKQFREWYGYSAARNLSHHATSQIAVPLLAREGSFTLIPSDLRGSFCVMASGGFTITIGSDAKVSSEYVVGLLNSKLLFWKLQQLSNVFRGGWITCTKQYFGELPIRIPSKATHDRIVALVTRMLDLHRQRAAARTPQEQTSLDRQIQSTDDEIDRLVYDLYGLTQAEIDIVEGREPAVSQTPPAELPQGKSTPQSEADAAHFYSAKEDPVPYRTGATEQRGD